MNNINYKEKYDSIISSLTSAVICKTITNPFERIKMLQQTKTHFNIKYYDTIIGSFKTIGKEEALIGYFKGNLTNIIRISPAFILRFELNNVYNDIFVKPHTNPTYLNHLASGVSMGVTQNLITYPIDVVRSLRTLDNNTFKNNSIPNCIRYIYKTKGFRGYYQGLSIALTTGSMYIGTQFSLYNYFKENYTDNTFIAGGSAGFIAQTIWYYGDSLKRNMHVNLVEKKYKNVFDCVKQLGIKKLYAGYRVNILKCIIETPLQFYIYENMIKIMKNSKLYSSNI